MTTSLAPIHPGLHRRPRRHPLGHGRPDRIPQGPLPGLAAGPPHRVHPTRLPLPHREVAPSHPARELAPTLQGHGHEDQTRIPLDPDPVRPPPPLLRHPAPSQDPPVPPPHHHLPRRPHHHRQARRRQGAVTRKRTIHTTMARTTVVVMMDTSVRSMKTQRLAANRALPSRLPATNEAGAAGRTGPGTTKPTPAPPTKRRINRGTVRPRQGPCTRPMKNRNPPLIPWSW